MSKQIEESIVFITQSLLDKIAHSVMKRSINKSDLKHTIGLAQKGVDAIHIDNINISTSSHIYHVLSDHNKSVQEWADEWQDKWGYS